MESLLREEVALLLATLVACGFLVLGTLELLWPTRPRRTGHPAGTASLAADPPGLPVAAASVPVEPVSLPVEPVSLLVETVSLPADPVSLPPDPPADPVPIVAAPLEPPARAEIVPIEDRPAVALRVGRALLARALEEPNPAADSRVRTLCRAVACLQRGVELAPEDTRLSETLAAAHEALALAEQPVAFRWLAATMPWRTAPAAEPAEPAAPAEPLRT